MAHKNSLKFVPMVPTHTMAWGEQIFKNDTLSCVDYDGETCYEYYYSEEEPNKQRYRTITPVMVENKPFTGDLTYLTYSRGRSAANMIFHNANGQRFSFFMSDFHEIVPLLENGQLSDTFLYVKKGRNFGVQLYRP